MNVNTYKDDEEKTSFSFKNIKRIFEFIKPHKKELYLAFLTSVCSSILLLFLPKLMSYAIDNSFPNKDIKELLILSSIMLVMVLISAFMLKVKNNKIIILIDNVAHDLKLALFKKLQYLPVSYFDTRSNGKIYTRAATYPDEVAGILCYVLLAVILDIINLILVVIFMLTSNVKLSLVTIIPAFILLIFYLFLSPIQRKIRHNINDKNSNVNAYLSESINGVRITQVFNREKKNQEILKDLENERIKVVKKILYVGNLNWSLTNIMDMITMVIVFYIGLKFMYPSVSLGIIMAISSYSSRFWEPLSYLASSLNDVMDASVYIERIYELLDEPLKIENSPNPKIVNIKGNVELKNVTFGYNAEKIVLENLNLKINNGEKVGFVGETGSGKTTILNLISRFYDPTKGEVLIDGVNIKDIDLANFHEQVAMMLQDNYLFQRSVYENLSLGKNISLEKVIEICKMLDIHEMIMELVNGYDTVLLNNGSNLSSGERQLLCLARIMVQDPKILILDEATSNIDIKTETKIVKALDIVTENRTTIMVAHRISTIKNCDKIVVIKNKKVHEEGTHNELMTKKGEYYKLYQRQSGV